MIKIIPIFIVILLSSKAFSGDLSDALSSAYDTSASASGETYKIGGRTVHTGGYVRIRIPVAEAPKLITMEGPSMQGGCNGFDIYGGSFSLISADEIVNWLEKVTDNSGALLTFTFMTYLKDQCSVCSDAMEWLYALQDLMNGAMGSSCEAAGMIVGGISTAIESKGESFSSPEFEAYAANQDSAISRLGQASKSLEDSADGLAKSAAGIWDNDTKKEEIAKGLKAEKGLNDTAAKNQADMILGGNLAFWLVFDGELDKHLSNLVGNNASPDTVLLPLTFATLGSTNFISKGDSTDPSGSAIIPWVDFNTLYNYDVNKDVINRKANILCPSYSETLANGACQEPVAMDFKLKDFIGDFEKMMEGVPGGSKGIINKLGQVDGGDDSKFTDEEEEFMKGLPNANKILGTMIKVSKHDSSVAADLYQSYKNKLKIDYLFSWFDAMFDGFEKASKTIAWPDDAKIMRSALESLISKRREVIRAQYALYVDLEGTTTAELTEAYNSAMAAAKLNAGVKTE